MANDLVRFATGLESNLSQETKEKGKILFAVTGDNKGYIYFDKDNNTRIKMSEHALTAEKDAANNTITTTYLKSIAQNSSTIDAYSIKSIAGANTTKDIITIPNASTTKAGLITGEAQTLGGNKTFNNSVTINDKLTVNEDIISLAGEPYMAQKEYTNILCTANNDPNGYLYYGQLKLKDYYTEWYLKMYISMDIPYDSTKAGTNAASYEGVVEYWGYANTITAYRIFNAHANTSYRTFWNHVSYRPKLAGCQTYGHLLGFRFYSSWNPASTGYGRNIKIKIIHTDNCTFNFLDNMILYTNAPGTGSTNFDGRSEYNGTDNGLQETGDANTRNHLIGAQYLKAGESCIDRYTIVMQEKGGDFSSICYKNATSNSNDNGIAHIKSTAHYVVGGPVYYAYSNAHTNAGALSSSQEFHTNYALDFRYSSNSGSSLTNGKMVYLKFEKDSEGYLTVPDHPWYSQELPTEEDGYVYMSLGIAYSTYTIYMFPEHEYYEYIAGQIRKYVHNLPVKQGGTGKTSWTSNQIVYASAATTLSQLPSGTDGQLLKSKGANAAPEWISPSSLLVGKATGDSAGDNIRSTYIKGLSVSGTTLTITKGDNSTSTLTLQDTNTDTKVTNTLNTTTKAYVTGTTSATTNTGTQIFDTGVYLDTTAGQLVATKFVGALQGNADTATKATGDSAGDNIRTTYIKGLSLNGLTLTITKGDNSSSTLTLQDLDVKVNMKARGTTKAYLLGTVTSPTSSDQAVTSVAETGVYFDTTAGKLVATTFKGALEGNADTATALKNGHTFKITDDSSTNTGNTVAFNGTQDVTLKLPADVKFSNITATSNITVNTGNIDIVNVKETDKFINLYYDANKTSGASWRLGHIGSGSGDTNYFVIQSGTSATGTTEWHNVIRLGMNSYDAHFGGNVNPLANNTQTLGTTSLKWKNVYATTFTGDLTGTAAKATGDGAGDNIRSTYIKSLSVSGTTLTITKGDSTTSTITLQDTNTDTKVTNTLGTTTKAYVTGTTSATTNTGTQIFDTGVYLDTTAGQLVATTFKGALDGNASTATKATGDSAGDNIRSTYIKGLSVSGTTLTITKGDNSTSTLTLQDTNTDTKVTNTLNTTTKAYITGTTSATTNTGTQIFDTGVYLDTTAGQLVATKFVGALQGNADTATKATGDSAGDNIRTTYIKGLSVSGLTLTVTKGDNSTSTLTLQDLDVKVNMKARGTTKAYLLGTTTSPTSSDQAVTSVAETGVYFDTTAGKLVATTFKGALEGNATTATKATGDSAGDNIRTTYIKSLSVSGTTLTITKGDNSTSTITLQDTNTDTKVTNTLGTTTKAYVTGTTSATTNTGTQIFDTGVYLDTTAGQLVATTFKGALDGNATSATKATNDGANNQITTTYLKAVSITGNDTTDVDGTTAITAGSKGFYTVTTGANTSTKYALPIAGESVAGIITNTAQTFGGNKTFKGLVTFPTANGFTYSGISVASDNAARPVWFSYNGVTGRPVYDNDFKYNPSTNTLTVTNVTGTAAKATADAANNTITTTYLAKISENSSTINSYSIKSSVGGNLSGTKDTVTIPNASTTKAGLITGEAQTLGGDKTFNDEVIVKDMLKAEADIISANGYPYIKKKIFTNIIATEDNTANGCFYLANIRPDNFYEPWNFRAFVHAYVPGHPEYNGLYDITITGWYAISGSVKYWNIVYSNFNAMNTSYRPIYYSCLRTLNETGYNANSPILWGVDLYASTNPTTTGYERTVEVVLIDTENCTFDFRDTPIKHANVTNTSHYYTYYSMDCANTGLRESGDSDTYDRTYATNYVRVGSSPIHRYSLIMQDTTDGFSSLVYKTKNSNNNDNAATGHVAATDVHFVPTGQVLYNSTGYWYNTSGSQTGSIGMYTAIPFDFRYASNCGASLTIGKPVYYVFNKNADDNTLSIDSTIHTQTLPTTEDGKVYMFLGIAYATTHIYLHHVHPMYEFIDGKLRTYRETIPVKQGGTGKSSWTANGLVYASGTSTLAQIGTGTDGQFLKSKGANAAPEWTNASDIAVNKAEKDGAGNVITTHYIKHGSIEVSDTNHNMTYTNGANGDTKTVSLPFVKLSGDTMTGDLLVQKTSGDTKVGVKNNNGNVELLTSTNRGIYDRTTTSWIVYRAPSGAITYLLSGTGTKSWQFNDNGNLTTPAGATATANLIGTASRAVGDSAGNQITTTYAAAGSFATDTTNHKITYTDGANTAKEFSAPFVLRAGDSMTGNLTTTGNMTAVKFIGALQGNADSASTLSHKTLNNTTLENTAGSFAFSGSGLPWDGTDWVGLQIGDSADKFQITANDGGLLFRQNDSGGTATSGWTSWTRLAYAPINTQVGSSTKGIYISNKGALTACDYELKATVNNATQYGVAYYSTATNITSTAAGGANTALMGKGSAAPAFVSVSPTLTLTAGTTAGPKVKITVLGVAGTDLQLPAAGSGASGVVTTDTQTFAGGKTFNNPITANATNDSLDSLSTSASLVVKGGVSVAKNLSAKTIRIDNNQTTEGVQLQYDETLDTLNFVFV